MKITNTKTYNVAESLPNPVEIQFMNLKGSFDIVQFTRYKDSELKFKANLFGAFGADRVSSVSSSRTETYYSTYLDEATYHWLVNDLLHSPVVRINGRYVRISDQSVKYDNLQKLYTIELTVSPEFEKNHISL
ncbi:hypothetical protein [Rufibacter ruber]|uniref:hypothetical protein n=1 Tax=Rufibacter ruber TaxID=1783499 RepID=UPI000833EC8F|nr:hypothetical protein [Rufibacter ruber]